MKHRLSTPVWISSYPKKFADELESSNYMKSSSFYERTYHLFYSTRSMLTSLRPKDDFEESGFFILNENDIQAYKLFISLIDTVLNSTFSTLFTNVNYASTEICSVFTLNISKNTRKLANSILASFLLLSKQFSLFICNQDLSQIDSQNTISHLENHKKQNETHSNDVDNSNSQSSETETLICRICDQPIPVDLMESHTIACKAAYCASLDACKISETIQKLQGKICETALNVSWPGKLETFVSLIMPVLQTILLLDQALEIDLSLPSAADDLDSISQILYPICISASNEAVAELIRQAKSLIEEQYSSALKLSYNFSKNSHLKRNALNTTIGDFTFLKQLSKGAFARVFLAKKNTTNDIYAVKALPRKAAGQKNIVRQNLKQALAERDIMFSLNSQHMVSFYYSFCGKNNLYIVMEYLPGGDLFSILHDVGALDEEAACIYTAQIIDALDFLRKNGIAHRDLKPANLLVDSKGRLKLIDFGLSFDGAAKRSASSSSILGTADYIAPEVWTHQSSHETVFAQDYWALGCIIYEFLVGVCPFADYEDGNESSRNSILASETNTTSIFARIQNGKYDEEALNEFSPEVKDLISKLLVKNPCERLGTKDIAEIKQHPWFIKNGIDFNNLQDLEPPFVPELESGDDSSYFGDERSTTTVDSDILEDIKLSRDEIQIQNYSQNHSKAKMRSSFSFHVSLHSPSNSPSISPCASPIKANHLTNKSNARRKSEIKDENDEAMQNSETDNQNSIISCLNQEKDNSDAELKSEYDSDELDEDFQKMSVQTLASTNEKNTEEYKRRCSLTQSTSPIIKQEEELTKKKRNPRASPVRERKKKFSPRPSLLPTWNKNGESKSPLFPL